MTGDPFDLMKSDEFAAAFSRKLRAPSGEEKLSDLDAAKAAAVQGVISGQPAGETQEGDRPRLREFLTNMTPEQRAAVGEVLLGVDLEQAGASYQADDGYGDDSYQYEEEE